MNKKEPNLIPMINIIFLLMIFFMLSGVISKKETILIDRPSSKNANEVKNIEFLTFSVLPNGKIFFKSNEINLKNLENIINSNDQGSFKKKIYLDIDKNVSVKTFDQILLALKNVNVNKVFINTKVKQ
tara:strand:- start:10107 stop:10490 length:384 start_codon:yes stop_codon:yes gene_type:complete